MDIFNVHSEVIKDLDLQLIAPALLLPRRDLVNDAEGNFLHLFLHDLLAKDVLKLPSFLCLWG